MKRTTKEIADYIGGELQGDGACLIESIAGLRHAGPSDLTYAEVKFHAEARDSSAGCIIVESGEFADRTTIRVRHPKLAFAKAAAWLLRPETTSSGIHPSAVIDSSTQVGRDVRVGPYAVIENDVHIGDRTRIEAGTVIGAGCRIGSDCIVYPRVVIYRGVEVGNRVIIHSGAVLGADGFGFVRDGTGHVKFPQVGRVIVEDDVEIGANTCIDRGSLETTVIRRGVKLDNLIQIAHNVEVGENTVIAAQTGISGSSTVGAQSIIGGQVGIGERARLDDRTIIGGQGGVLNAKHVRGGEILWGTPVRPLKEFLEQQAHVARLPKLAAAMRALAAEIEKLKIRDS